MMQLLICFDDTCAWKAESGQLQICIATCLHVPFVSNFFIGYLYFKNDIMDDDDQLLSEPIKFFLGNITKKMTLHQALPYLVPPAADQLESVKYVAGS